MNAILFLFYLILHNGEELLFIRRQDGSAVTPFGRRSTFRSFAFAVVGITLLVFWVVSLHLFFPDSSFWELAYLGCVGAMLVNAVVPHLILTISTRSYSPGVFTGCFLMIPCNSMILYQAFCAQYGFRELLFATGAMGALLLISIPLFEKLADRIFP